MEILSHRPAALACLVFVYTGFISVLLPFPIRMVLCAAAILCLFLLPRVHRFSTTARRVLRISLCAFLCGGVFFSLYTDGILGRTISRLDGKTVTITGTVQRTEFSTAYSAGYELALTKADGKPLRATVLLECPATTLMPGEVIHCQATLSAFAETNGDFAERRYYFSRGFLTSAETDAVQRVGMASMGIRGFFDSLRATLTAHLQLSMGRRDSALPAALLLGDKSLLPEDLSRDFRRLGISHLLVISGMHFTILLGAAERVLTAFLPSKKGRMAILAALTVFYMLLSGMSETVVRSAIMMLFSIGAVLLERSTDMPTSLGISAALICIFSPASFYSVGFQLSVTAVLGISLAARVGTVLALPPAEGRFWRLKRIVHQLLQSAVIQLFLLPLLCLYFGETSLLTPIATLLFSPILELILILTPLLFIFPGLNPLIILVTQLSRGSAWLAAVAGKIPGISVSLNYALCPVFVCAVVAVLLLALLQSNPKRARQMLACTLGLLLCFGGYLTAANLHNRTDDRVISPVMRAENDALILVSEGKYMLCDIGNGSYSALHSAYAEAAREHATELEAVMLTHLHKRHIRGFDRLSDTVCVRALIVPAAQNENEHSILYSLEECAREKDIPIYIYIASADASITFGRLTLYPAERVYLSRSTHPVITLQIESESGTLAYMGTSWNETDHTPAADAVILGAHGPIYKKQFTLPRSPQTLLCRGKSGEFLSEIPPGIRQANGTKRVIFRLSH